MRRILRPSGVRRKANFGFEQLERREVFSVDFQVLKDIAVGPLNANPHSLTVVGEDVFFLAKDEEKGRQLWKTDGTSQGTVRVTDTLNFKSNGIFEIANIDGTLFFAGEDAEHGIELWKSDGTPEGTTLVKDIATGPESSRPRSLTNIGGVLYFSGVFANGYGLWRSDGTPEGTTFVTAFSPEDELNPLTTFAVSGNELYIQTSVGLWKSDGTSEGTTRIVQLPHSDQGFREVVSLNGIALFHAPNGNSVSSLWRSDGTSAGSFPIKEFSLGSNQSEIIEFTAIGSYVYFIAQTESVGFGVWRTDGTTAGTQIVFSPEEFGGVRGTPFGLANVNGTLFFSCNREGNNEVWKSDGTTEGTVRVQSFLGGLTQTSFIVATSSQLFIDAKTPEIGNEVFVATLTDVLPGLSLSEPVVPENSGIGVNVGQLELVKHDSIQVSLSLPPELGDNQSFELSGSTVITNEVFDFESKAAYTLIVQILESTGFRSYQTLTVTVRDVNEAPVINTAPVRELKSIFEDDRQSSGTPISALTSFVFDADVNARRGIAITSLSGLSTGKWQYTIDGGESWWDAGKPSVSRALLLPSQGTLSRLRYVPRADFNGDVQVAYRAWDQSMGQVGKFLDTAQPKNGGSTSVSSAIENARLRVRPVNDAPQIVDSRVQDLGALANTELASPKFIVKTFVDTAAKDIDRSTPLGIAIDSIGNPRAGSWEYSLSGEKSWHTIPEVSRTSLFLLPPYARIRFVPSAGFVGLATIRFRAWDLTVGKPAELTTLEDQSPIGGTSPFSRTTISATLNIEQLASASEQ